MVADWAGRRRDGRISMFLKFSRPEAPAPKPRNGQETNYSNRRTGGESVGWPIVRNSVAGFNDHVPGAFRRKVAPAKLQNSILSGKNYGRVSRRRVDAIAVNASCWVVDARSSSFTVRVPENGRQIRLDSVERQ